MEENLVPFIMVKPNKISEHIFEKNKNRVMPPLRKVKWGTDYLAREHFSTEYTSESSSDIEGTLENSSDIVISKRSSLSFHTWLLVDEEAMSPQLQQMD